MKVVTAANHFNREFCIDAYDPFGVGFYGRIHPFNESTRDGSTVIRRVLSVAPGTKIPMRKAITAGSSIFLMGKPHVDWFRGSQTKLEYVLQEADGLANVGWSAEVLTNFGGTPAGEDIYVSLIWLKSAKDEMFSSERFNIYNVYTSSAESISRGQLFELNGKFYRVAVVLSSAAGFTTAECYELDSGPQAVEYVGRGTKDIATDQYTALAPVMINAIVERYKGYYERDDEGASKGLPGDVSISFSQSDIVSPKIGDYVTIGTDSYDLIEIRDDGYFGWVAQGRPRL